MLTTTARQIALSLSLLLLLGACKDRHEPAKPITAVPAASTASSG